jgi:hypothetical protein
LDTASQIISSGSISFSVCLALLQHTWDRSHI